MTSTYSRDVYRIRVLVVEDDPTVRGLVGRYLDAHGYTAVLCATGLEGRDAIRSKGADLAIIDRMLPGLSGDDLCREVRATTSTPVIMLTALSDVSDRIDGFELGADDYVPKPFSMKELLLRVAAVLRRHNEALPVSRKYSVGDFDVDPGRRRITVRGKEAQLTAREYELLLFLLNNPGCTLSRAEILEGVWEWSFGDAATVTVHVRRLREKIESDPAAPVHLITEWGAGYRFNPEAAA